MNIYKVSSAVAVLFLLLSCTGCPSSSSGVEGEEPVYTPDVVWTLETNVYSPFYQPSQYGQYLYCSEDNRLIVKSDAEHRFDILKVDLNAGTKVWKSLVFSGLPETDIVRCGERVFVQNGAGYLYVLSDADGSLLATVALGGTDEEMLVNKARGGTMISCDGNLFWSGVYEKDEIQNNGFMKFTVDGIDFSNAEDEVQIVCPKCIWRDSDSDRTWVRMTPMAKDGIVYFQTYIFYEDALIKTVALYADTGKVKWERGTTVMTGEGEKAMYAVDGKLYILSEAIGCYDLETGDAEYEIIQSGEELQTEPCVSASAGLVGASYSDGKFYYTSNASWSTSSITGIPEALVHNIKCLDAATGKLVWGDLPKGCGSLSTRPIVENGKVFVTGYGIGLRVYDKNTGRLLGVDKDVYTLSRNANAQYGGLVMYFNLRSDHTSTLTAIRP